MQEDKESVVTYDRAGFASRHNHHVRTSVEAEVCEWLMQHGIAHRHASEIFTVPTGPRRTALIYVPDIILHDRNEDGRKIIIETLQVNSPKSGGTRLLAAFRKAEGHKYFIIIVTRRSAKRHLVKGSCDVVVDIEKLDMLIKKIPPPPVSL